MLDIPLISDIFFFLFALLLPSKYLLLSLDLL